MANLGSAVGTNGIGGPASEALTNGASPGERQSETNGAAQHGTIQNPPGNDGGSTAHFVMTTFDSIILYVVLAIVGIHHVLRLSYELLHWPGWLVRHFEKRRKREVMQVLESLGFDEEMNERIAEMRMRTLIKEIARYDDPREKCETLLHSCAQRGQFSVGSRYAQEFGYFIDVMSASIETGFAEECANILVSYLEASHRDTPLVFDKVVGIKEGSPNIAMKFGEKLRKAVVLFRGDGNYKHGRSEGRNQDLFDGALAAGERVIIVDDSSTGGRKVLNCIGAIRSVGCEVSHCLVLFEPIGKDARGKFKQQSVELLAVVTMDQRTQARVLRQ